MSAALGLRPIRALAHPFFGAALGLLLLNDHFLKHAGVLPHWLTGKLSDFAGLIVAGALLSALCRARSRAGIGVAQAAVGLGFAALKLSPIAAALADSACHLVHLHWHTLVDPTDLVALTALPPSWFAVVRLGARPASYPREMAGRALGAVGLVACAASTTQYVDQQPPPAQPNCDAPSTYDRGYGGSTPKCPDHKGEDICNDGIDNDNNGRIDCEDPNCAVACADIEGACNMSSANSALLHFDALSALDGSTLTGTSVSAGSCVGKDSPEVIFQGFVSVPGVLTLSTAASHGVYVRKTCQDEFTEIACDDGKTTGAFVTVPVVAGENLTIIVDANDPFKAGPFHMPLTFQPSP